MSPELTGRAPLIQHVLGRRTISLDGDWRAIVDPYEHGYRDYHGGVQSREAYFRDAKAAGPSDCLEYDFDAAMTLKVPGDWNSQAPELLWYEGTVWYRKRFSFRPTAGTRVFLRFGAASAFARVFLDGELLGEHRGAFTPFEFEVTERLGNGEHSLVVQVNNERHRDGVPALATDWWNFGGLTRSVCLVEVPRTFVRDYSLALDATGAIVGTVRLDGPDRTQPVTVAVPEAGLRVTATPDAAGVAAFALPGEVERWSPGAPRLYAVELATATDRVVDRVGFRRIEVHGREVRVNGEPVFFRGISVHEQGPLRAGRAHGLDDARILLGWAQELGANCVRLAHYPHDEATVRLADELGLFVWAEIPVYWAIDWENPATLANARAQLTELIERDRNRAAVVIWSVGNETPQGAARLAFMTELVRTARALDPTRLVTAALERHDLNEWTTVVDDPLGDTLDLIGCNEYIGWYDGLPEKADRMAWRVAHDKPVFVSEFGADALGGLRGDPGTRWTEDFQASVYEHTLPMLELIPGLVGMSPWILADFRSPRRPLPGILDYWNRKGLISDQGHRKLAFQILQAEYQRRIAAAATGLK